jgi:multidrug efflux pump subunit AcrB
MGIVKFALRFPHTFYVLAILAVFLGGFAIATAPEDIFPSINIPVVTVIWQYTGLTPKEMEARVTTYGEYSISSNVGDIKNIESQTLTGLSVQRVFFQPHVNIDLAISQIVAATNSIRALMPSGIEPPTIVQFNASSVPVLQLSLSSDRLNEQQLFDYGIYRMRQTLAPLPGITLPPPYGGKYRQIMVDLDPPALLAKGLTPLDVLNAVNAQSLTLPSGAAKIGDTQFIVALNAVSPSIQALNDLPIKTMGGATIFLKDVAHVRDGWAVQQNVVRADGRRSVLLTIIKNGDASTLDVVNRVKEAMPEIQKAAPPGMEIKLLFDQSVFVQTAIDSVLREGAIAAALTGLMILLFLGSWRSTTIVLVSIPLSILTSIAVFSALGETLNTMTLGGLALAVGILVDDSTVTIENTHRLLEDGVEFDQAVLEGAAGIAVPTLISTLAISCVFISVAFLTGPALYLFSPLAMAVVFAMLASYLVSRTLTPIVIRLLLRREHERRNEGGQNWLDRFHQSFNRRFDAFRDFYVWLLTRILAWRILTPVVAVAFVVVALCLTPFVGRDFFPRVDAGQITLHVRAKPLTRIEKTEEIFQNVEDVVRQDIPPKDLALILDDIGLPQRTYSLAFGSGTMIGTNDGQVLISLKEGHASTLEYMRNLRHDLKIKYPDLLFYYEPADMVTQILNFGIPAQIDVQVQGPARDKNLQAAREIQTAMTQVPGLVDVHIQQELDAPELYYQVDRSRALQFSQQMQTVADNLNISLSSSEQVSPNFWSDPANGTPYYLAVQTPEYKVSSVNDLNNTPITSSTGATNAVPNLLGNIAHMERRPIQTVYGHENIQNVFDIYASAQNRDLGSTSAALDEIVERVAPELPPGNKIVIRGQIESMNSAFDRMGLGLLFAAVFVYLLMVVNYQSFIDPLAVILALPGAGAGIILMLFVTGTALSIPSLMGAIMAVGVASANSILLVTFAREQHAAGHSPVEAALSAGATRIRPVLMTAAAMIVGMVPMAIGSPGEEQNAVLARAVIGGLIVGTLTTLLFVPYLYSLFGRFEKIEVKAPGPHDAGGAPA